MLWRTATIGSQVDPIKVSHFLLSRNELRRMIWSHLSYVYVVHSRMTCWSAHVTVNGDLENILLVPFTMKGLRDFL